MTDDEREYEYGEVKRAIRQRRIAARDGKVIEERARDRAARGELARIDVGRFLTESQKRRARRRRSKARDSLPATAEELTALAEHFNSRRGDA